MMKPERAKLAMGGISTGTSTIWILCSGIINMIVDWKLFREGIIDVAILAAHTSHMTLPFGLARLFAFQALVTTSTGVHERSNRRG